MSINHEVIDEWITSSQPRLRTYTIARTYQRVSGEEYDRTFVVHEIYNSEGYSTLEYFDEYGNIITDKELQNNLYDSIINWLN
jgi:hypothetical protein